jgi:hypothetical protein
MEMPRFISFLAALALVAGIQPAMADVVSPRWKNPANGHTYFLISEQTWRDAQSEAESLGGHLVTINDRTEEAWLAQQLDFGRFWIGFTDDPGFGGSEGSFVWTSGENSDYTNWSEKQPSNDFGNEHYAEIRVSQGSTQGWNDLPNAGKFYPGEPIRGIVEIGPEPSDTVLLVAVLVALLVIWRLAVVWRRRSSQQ